ncbi:MAG: oligopeptide transporter, OPT family [Sedimentisphaerales bacterium]|nr:oligopeptide transporter, OPT family [Sedimentisphaerales bacterium]
MKDSNGSLLELTVKSVVLGVLLAVVLAGANAYLGLFAGMTVSASIPAAVVSMGVLRLFRRSSILENNLVQTAASAGESLAAGVIFTLPALVIMDYWSNFNFWWVTIIAAFGGILGVLFTIPLRRALIVEGNLQFPEGIATAEVLKTGARGGAGLRTIAQAAAAAALFKFGEAGLKIWNGVFETARQVRGSVAYFGSNLSPALLSVGYIVGLNISMLIFLGGLANWLVAIPLFAAGHDWGVYPAGHESAGQAMSALDWANAIWLNQTRYIGVGGMVVGGLWTILRLRKSLGRGIRSGLEAYRRLEGDVQPVAIDRTEKDIPMKWVLILIVASVAPLFILYQVFVQQVSVSLPMAVTMLAAGFVFSAVAGYMAGLVGSSNNPISGVTIATVLVASLLLLGLMGRQAANGPAAAIIIGAVVCCAAAIAGDNMQDLKAGYLVGATPWKQQVMQMVGTASSAFVMAPILMLLFKAYGFEGHASGAGSENALAAVQANLMASVSQGVFRGGLPWDFMAIGAVVSAGIILLDTCLERRGSGFRTPVLAVAIGFYLPLELSVPIFAGGVIHFLLDRRYDRRGLGDRDREEFGRRGLLFASGLITGEALVGILMAIPIVITGNKKVLAVIEEPLGAWPGIVLLVGVAVWLYWVAAGRSKPKAGMD